MSDEFIPLTDRAFSIEDIQEFASRNDLVIEFNEKPYACCEVWSYASSQIALSVSSTQYEQTNKTPIEFKAEAELTDVWSGKMIGKATAICSQTEENFTAANKAQILSMAQTRAMGKVMKLNISWLINMLGLESTPAEEMDKDIVRSNKDSKKTKSAKSEIIQEMDGAQELVQELRNAMADQGVKEAVKSGKLKQSRLDTSERLIEKGTMSEERIKTSINYYKGFAKDH